MSIAFSSSFFFFDSLVDVYVFICCLFKLSSCLLIWVYVSKGIVRITYSYICGPTPVPLSEMVYERERVGGSVQPPARVSKDNN